MRDRPFLSAGESPRPFSEIRREREFGDVGLMARRALLQQIARLEGEAKLADNHQDWASKQLEAEALRCRLHHEGSA